MSLIPVALKAAASPVTHRIESSLAIQVGTTRFENQMEMVVSQTLVKKTADSYLIDLQIIDFNQQAEDLFSQVTADLNQVSRRLLLRMDVHGQITQVVNAFELVKHWQEMRPLLEKKYVVQPAVRPFFDAFERQLRVPGTFEQSLRNKGIYGALFPGLYGRPLDSGQGRISHRQIESFFNHLPLPLRLTTLADTTASNAFPPELLLATTGELDESQFDALGFQRLIQSIVDDVLFPVNLEISHTEIYSLDLNTGWIARGTQQLTAEVPGAYFHQSKHVITAITAVP